MLQVQKTIEKKSASILLRSKVLLATAAVLSVTASPDTNAATPEAGKSPVRIADKDWVIQIVPGPAIGPSPVPAFNANARKAAMKLAAKAQQAVEAAEAVQPADEPVQPKKKTPTGKATSAVEPEPTGNQTAETQPLPVIIPAIPDPEGSPSQVVLANCEQPMSRSINPGAYAEIYNSIPYSRAEYFANPAYRHEATMEIMFGQLRPRTVTQMSVPMTQTTQGFAIPFRSHSTGRQHIFHHYSRSPYSSSAYTN